MRASEWQPEDGRGLEQCFEAVKGIVDWDRKRYSHFNNVGESLAPFFAKIFPPSATGSYSLMAMRMPTWTTFLVDESGGQDRSLRYRNQFRALNMPAAMHGLDVFFNSSTDPVDMNPFLENIPDYYNDRIHLGFAFLNGCLLYTSPSPRD